MKAITIILAITVGLIAGVTSVGAEDHAPAPEAGSPAVGNKVADATASTGEAPTKSSPVVRNIATCLVDEAALADFREQKKVLDASSKELAAQKTELSTRERAIEEELKKLVVVRDEIVKLKTAFKKENEAKVSQLIETFETMSPKAASLLISSIDEGLAVAAMSRMSIPKLAKIMNIMDQEKSARLTEALAGIARPNSPVLSRKGGEKPNGNKNESNSDGNVSDRKPASAQTPAGK